jgi:hypothetical protein
MPGTQEVTGTVTPPAADRRLAGGFALLGLAAFTAAAWLDPYDAAGRPLPHGTHRQLGLPPCMLNLVTGLPCPACGMTTSISLLVHGDPASAWRVNWAGTLVGLLGAATTLWLAARAAGLSAGRQTAETAVCRLVITAAILATVRYATLVAAWFGVA